MELVVLDARVRSIADGWWIMARELLTEDRWEDERPVFEDPDPMFGWTFLGPLGGLLRDDRLRDEIAGGPVIVADLGIHHRSRFYRDFQRRASWT